jgi:hypothetical protein
MIALGSKPVIGIGQLVHVTPDRNISRHRNISSVQCELVCDCPNCVVRFPVGTQARSVGGNPTHTEIRMKTLGYLGAMALLIGAAVNAQGQDSKSIVVTTSNAAVNQLLVYDSTDKLIQTVATNGKGGVSGNAGGVTGWRNHIAVVNFGSQNVSLFEPTQNGFKLAQVIPAASSPVSVAFGNDHLYILGTTKVESHRMFGFDVSSGPDGVATLLKADGSSAQVGVVGDQLIISEKSNAIETVALSGNGAVSGLATLVQNIPANVNAPFGLVTRGNDAYVTIAHADEISLVRNDDVLTTTGSGTQHAPCWLALDGPFLFASNTASNSVSRFAVYGQKIVPDDAVAATLGGGATDIAHRAGLVAVIDSAGTVSHLSIFTVDEDGNLTLKGVSTINSPANGVAIVRTDD